MPQDEVHAPAWFEDVVTKARGRARDRVAKLREEHPGLERRALADELVRRFARRAGLGGAATGALSIVALPVGLPAGLALTLAFEAELLLSLLELYGVPSDGEAGRVKLYALWAGSGAADALKNAGLHAGAGALAQVLAGSLPARLIAKIHPALLKLVLRRLGLGWVPRVMKLWPLLGAPLGYVLDSAAVRALGRAAITTLEEADAARA